MAGGVRFAGVDFGRDSVGAALGRAGFDAGRPALVSWLGVTMYLDEAAIEETVAALGGFAPGSELVVDYMLPAGLRDAAGQMYADLVGQAAADWGEPWRSVFAPEAMAGLLGRHGFGQVRDVRQRDMVPAAAWDRSDSLRPIELSRIAHATVAAAGAGEGDGEAGGQAGGGRRVGGGPARRVAGCGGGGVKPRFQHMGRW
jgi:O-methyltransferase involved in polyketide biosynthesis